MSILSSLKNIGKSVVSSVTSAAKNVVSSLSASVGASKPSAPNQSVLPSSISLTSSPAFIGSSSYNYGLPNQSIAPKSTTQRSALPSAPMSYMPGTPGGMSTTPQLQGLTTKGTSYSGSSSTKKKKETPPPPPPTTAASGTTTATWGLPQAGSSGSFGTAHSTPAFVPTTGTSGRSSMTGTLSAVGGLGTPFAPGSSEEETGPVQGENVLDRYRTGAPYQYTPPKNALDIALKATAEVESTPSVNVGNQFNAGDVQAGVNAAPETRQTRDQEIARIQAEALRIKEILDSGNFDEPVEETPEQMKFMEESEDPYGITQAMDNYRRQETNLIQLQKQRNDIYNSIAAITQSYEAVYDDIRSNPDLPKGLAKRRLEQLYEKQKGTLDSLKFMLDSTNSAIDDQNGMVNRAFGIVENAQDQEEKANKRKMDYLSMYINSGAIAGMSDEDIEDLAQATGMNPKGLKRVRDVKLSEQDKKDLEVRQLGNGDTVVIDKSKGTIVSNLGGRKASNDPGSTTTLASVDIQRYKEMYPSAGIIPGDTEADVTRKIKASVISDATYAVNNNKVSSKSQLQAAFPELSEEEIDSVWSGKPVSTAPATKSFFERIFGTATSKTGGASW